MREYWIRYVKDGAECVVILPSRLKVCRWVVQNLHRCRVAMITVHEEG